MHTFASLMVLIVAAVALAEVPTREEVADRFRSTVGEPLDLAEDGPLFNALAWVGPQPDAELMALDAQGRDVAARWSQPWVRHFFKSGHAPELADVGAYSYYLSKGEEPSLLLYRWEDDAFSFHLTESGNAMLLRIAPRGGEEGDEQSADESIDVASILFTCIDVGYETPEAFADAFGLKSAPAEGVPFTGPDWMTPGLNTDWRDQIIGFRIDRSVYVILYKTSGGGAAAVMEYRPHWLDAELRPADAAATQPATRPAGPDSDSDGGGA